MNKFLPLAAIAAIFIYSGFAAEERRSVSVQPPPAEESPTLPRFNLDFPGGTPSELVEAISKAMGKPVNVVVPVQAANVRIMPVKVNGVNVRELFGAISQGSGRRTVFISESPNSEEPVWWFASESTGAEAPKVCRYFQLAPYLRSHTIEDITTAIQTGWKMLGVESTPQLSFHKETNLLIAVGSEYLVGQIPAVLSELAADKTLAISTVVRLQEEIAELQEKKEPGWEEQVARKEDRIREEAVRVKAIQALNNPRFSPPPVMPVQPNRNQ